MRKRKATTSPDRKTEVADVTLSYVEGRRDGLRDRDRARRAVAAARLDRSESLLRAPVLRVPPSHHASEGRARSQPTTAARARKRDAVEAPFRDIRAPCRAGSHRRSRRPEPPCAWARAQGPAPAG